ncbi:hypothetical protein PRUPE_5G015400 [Prunus persica]|uniref:Uncharacterized protein n=1 Tax=Prunus persica TaxID=3760 RepID=M5WCH0_PRUPE|nr:hypothetical protein PRUPE_5G015400 [Prunus persica]
MGEIWRKGERVAESTLLLVQCLSFWVPIQQKERAFCRRTTSNFYPWARQHGSPLEAHLSRVKPCVNNTEKSILYSENDIINSKLCMATHIGCCILFLSFPTYLSGNGCP